MLKLNVNGAKPQLDSLTGNARMPVPCSVKGKARMARDGVFRGC